MLRCGRTDSTFQRSIFQHLCTQHVSRVWPHCCKMLDAAARRSNLCNMCAAVLEYVTLKYCRSWDLYCRFTIEYCFKLHITFTVLTIISQIKSNQIKSNQIKSNQIKSNQIKSNQIKSNQIKSNQIKSNQIKTLFIEGDT